jgi:hypothetical protein
MLELERRLRRAAPPRRLDSEDLGVRTPLKKAAGAEPDARSTTSVRPGADPESARPAARVVVEESAMAPAPPDDGSGEQPEADAVDPLPTVEELANRVPAEARAVLEELFRAKWTAVRRLRPEDLRS